MTALLRRSGHGLAAIASLAFFVLMWELLVRLLHIRPIMLPPPSTVFAELWTERAWYLGHAWYTLLTTLAGFALAVVFGVAIAVLLVSSRWFESAVYPLIIALNSVPKVAISLALIGAIVGEFVASQRGLGYVILSAQGTFDTPRVFAAIIMLVIMGIALFGALAWLERVATPWRRRGDR
jgi:NitT/TauT family transport system permease protein